LFGHWCRGFVNRLSIAERYCCLSLQYRNGSASGVVELSRLPNVLDALAIMRLNSSLWSDANNAIVMSWFRKLLTWYTTAPLGAQAKAATNNIALWYYQVRWAWRRLQFYGDRVYHTEPRHAWTFGYFKSINCAQRCTVVIVDPLQSCIVRFA
jgi:hypothetical protein